MYQLSLSTAQIQLINSSINIHRYCRTNCKYIVQVRLAHTSYLLILKAFFFHNNCNIDNDIEKRFVLRLQYILIFIDWSESDILLNINTNTALHFASTVLNMAFPIIPGPPYTPFTTVLCLLHFKLSQTIRLISLRVFRHVDLQFVSFCKLFFNSSHFSSC